MVNKERNISVLMPVRNGFSYLPKSINSIIQNIGPNDQIVIINDGSTDESPKILKDWSTKLNNLTVLNTDGIGIVKALNLGLEHCENNWVARFDVDDEYSSSRIKEQINLIDDETVGIFSDYSFIDETGKDFGFMSSAIFKAPVSISLVNSVRTAHPVAMFNREAVIDSGGYQTKDFPAEDLSLWLRLSKMGNLVSVPEALIKYRIRKGSITNEKRDLALQKKYDVIKFYGLNRSNLVYCNNEIQSILDSYNLTTFGVNRKILFLRDLIAANKEYSFNSVLNLKLISILRKEIATREGISEVARLAVDKRRRNQLRKSLE